MRRFLPLSFVLAACAGEPGADAPAAEPHAHHHAGGHHRFEDAEAWAAGWTHARSDRETPPHRYIAEFTPTP